MPVRENLELYGPQEQEQIIQMLIDESGAMIHPHQADAYILESLPFHVPGQVDDHASILSFNTLPPGSMR